MSNSDSQSPEMIGTPHPVLEEWEKPTPPVRLDGFVSVGDCVALLFVAEEIAALGGDSEEVHQGFLSIPLC